MYVDSGFVDSYRLIWLFKFGSSCLALGSSWPNLDISDRHHSLIISLSWRKLETRLVSFTKGGIKGLEA